MADKVVEEIYLGEMYPELFGNMTGEDDVYEGMKALGIALSRMGYTLASGKDGKPNELWALKKVP